MIERKTIDRKIVVINDEPLFGKQNKMLMGIGAAIIILGMIVMAGGKSPDPKVFNYNEVYSKTRVTLAPILIIAGIIVEIFAIFMKSNTTTVTEQQ